MKFLSGKDARHGLQNRLFGAWWFGVLYSSYSRAIEDAKTGKRLQRVRPYVPGGFRADQLPSYDCPRSGGASILWNPPRLLERGMRNL